MKWIKFVIAGFYFGFILIKPEAISWYRIVEMFHFQSFHMFGIIGSALGVGTISVLVIKKLNQSVFKTQPIDLTKKAFSIKSPFVGWTYFWIRMVFGGCLSRSIICSFRRGKYYYLDSCSICNLGDLLLWTF